MDKVETKNPVKLMLLSITFCGLKNALLYFLKVNTFSLVLGVSFCLFVDKTVVDTFLNWISVNTPDWKSEYGLSLILIIFSIGIFTFRNLSKIILKYLKTVWKIPDNILTTLFLVISLTIIYIHFLDSNYIEAKTFECLKIALFPYLISFFSSIIFLNFINFVHLILGKVVKIKSIHIDTDLDQDILDEPITNDSDDILDRKDFVNEFYSQVVNLPYKSSFVFALQGEWGEGKTSVINLLTNRFNKNPGYIVFRFDPWYFENDTALINMFMRDLGIVISNNYIIPSLRKSFYRYGKLIMSSLDKYLPIKSDTLYTLLADETVDQVKNNLIKKLSRLNKKIVIIIDNIDRLQSSEILATFKLINLVGNFPNTVFILSFDKNIVNKTLTPADAGSEYLEKIIQKTIQLPKPKQKTLDDYLGSRLDNLVELSDLPQKEKDKIVKDFQDFYGDELINVFPTLRRIKTFLNSLRASISSYIRSEVYLFDVFLLEVLKVFYMDVFTDLWKNRWYYMNYEWGFESMVGSPFSSIVKDDVLNKQIQDHINKLIEQYSDRDKGIIRSILSKLFLPVEKAFHKQNYNFGGMAKTYRMERRVSYPDVLKKYFIHNVSEGELFDSDVRVIIQNINQIGNDLININKYVFEIFNKFGSDGTLKELIQKLDLFMDEFAGEIVEPLIKSIYAYVEKNLTVKELSDLGWESIYHRFFALMFTLINERVEKKRIFITIKDIILKAPVYFALMSASWATSSKESSFYDIKNNVNKDKLIKLLNKRLFDYYVKSKRNIFRMNRKMSGFVLRNWAELSDESRKIVNKYLFQLINKNHSYVGRIIDGFMIHWSNERAQIEYDDLQSIYDIEKLHKITKNLTRDLYINNNERSAIETFNKVYDDRKAKALVSST